MTIRNEEYDWIEAFILAHCEAKELHKRICLKETKLEGLNIVQIVPMGDYKAVYYTK